MALVADPGHALLCFSGIRLSTKGKLIQEWLNVAGLPNEGERFPDLFERGRDRLGYWLKLTKWSSVGEIWSFPHEEGKPAVLFARRGERVGRWENREDVLAWKAQESGDKAEFEARKQGKLDPILAELDGLRAAYRRLNNANKAQLLAKVVRYIVRGS